MYKTESVQFMNRVTNVLSKPIQTRCAELTVLFDQWNRLPELQTLFPVIVEDIFGPRGTKSWGLRTTTATVNCLEFQALQHFLSPFGAIFKLMYMLLSDPMIKYEFEVEFLPLKVRQMLETTNRFPFYASVIRTNPQTKQIISLTLNPFDYYMFHFAYHLINPWHQRTSGTSCASNWNTVYYVLCCDYVLHFLPTDPSTPVLPLLNSFNGKSPVEMLECLNRPVNTTKYIRSNIFNNTIEYQNFQQTYEHHFRNQIWRSETVLTVFIDMWLNNDNISQIRQGFDTSARSLQFNELPTGEYIRIIRVLVKQLHAFASSAKTDDTNMIELKQIAIPMLQGKLYVFLRNLVHRWPLDGSFRLVLELWLSFIQPWRYPGAQHVKFLNQQEINPDVEDIAIGPMKSVDREYLPFIAENLLSYIIIFQQLLPRFSRVDLSSPKMSLMLYRLTKVFNQPNLADLLREIENCIENNEHSPSHSFNTNWTTNILPPLSPTSKWSTNMSFNSMINKSNTSPEILKSSVFNSQSNRYKSGKWSSVVKQKINELEGPNFCYKPLFTKPVATEVYDLLVQVKQAKTVADMIVQSRLEEIKNQTFFKRVASFFLIENSSDEFSLEERKKVPVYLNYALQHLTDIFQIDDVHITEQNITLNTTGSSAGGICTTESLRCLTPDKVRERINNIKFEGNPDALPPSANENAFLVKVLYQLSNLINTQFEDEINILYHREDYLGRLTRQILCSPITTYRLDKSQGQPVRVASVLPPRISLRSLASYRFLVYMFIGIVISVCFDFYSIKSFLVIIFIGWFLIKCLKAIPRRSIYNFSQ